jgi:carbon-monoxide dehydrogenase medium subunit
MWNDYLVPNTIEEALTLLSHDAPNARIIAGGTDLVLELDRGTRHVGTLIDISRLPDQDGIWLDDAGWIHLGALVTHNHVVASELCVSRAFPLARACREVGAPQIRNRATVAGNLITASPANDTITPLMALNARVTLRSVRGERQVDLSDFYTGVRRTVMAADELLTEIAFPALKSNQHGTFIKLGLRRAQAISLVNCAVILTLDEQTPAHIQHAAITLGAVAPTIIHAREAEAALVGQVLSSEVIAHTAQLAQTAARPIDDVRSSANYRRRIVGVITRRALTAIADGAERATWLAEPALLWEAAQQGRTLGVPSLGAGEQGSTGAREQGSTLGVPSLGTGERQSKGETLPSIPAPRHPSSEAPLHPGTPAPPLPGSEAPLHPGTPAPIRLTVNGQAYAVQGAAHKTLLRLLREDCGLVGSKEGCAEGECGACTVIMDGKAVMACLVPAPRANGALITTIEGLSQEGHLHPLQQAFIDEGAVQCGYCTPGFLMAGAVLLKEYPHPTPAQVKEGISGNLCRCTGYYKILSAFDKAASGQESSGQTVTEMANGHGPARN